MARLRKPRTAAEATVAHVKAFFDGHSIRTREWPSGPVKTRVPGFEVYEAGPGPRFGGWSYVTTGCWDATARNEHGGEFVLSASEPSLRHVELLTMVAYYHAGPEHQRLDLGHTLDIGVPWTKESLCTHLLISLPYFYGPEFEICAWPGGHARILAVQPITAAERAFKIEHGVEALEQRLEDAKATFASPYRPSVV
jgi:hypothetical protein